MDTESEDQVKVIISMLKSASDEDHELALSILNNEWQGSLKSKLELLGILTAIWYKINTTPYSRNLISTLTSSAMLMDISLMEFWTANRQKYDRD